MPKTLSNTIKMENTKSSIIEKNLENISNSRQKMEEIIRPSKDKRTISFFLKFIKIK